MLSENFKDHPVFQQINAFKEILNNEEKKVKIEDNEYSFIVTAIKFIEERLDRAIPSIVQDVRINNISSQLSQALGQINSFLTNQNKAHLNNSRNYFELAFEQLRFIPIAIPSKGYSYSKEQSSFAKTIAEQKKTFEKRHQSLIDKVTKLDNDLKARQTELTTLKNSIQNKQVEINNITTNFNTDYNNVKNAANNDFQKEIRDFKEEVNQIKVNFNSEKEQLKEELEIERTQYEDEIDKLKKEINEKSQNIVTDLEAKLKESKKIVGIIGNIGATGNYQKIADYHKKQANTWRWIALFFMVVLTGLLLFTIYHITGHSFNWQVATVRIVAFSALLYPASYASKESTKHRELENLNRKYELELASINPFIEILPEDKKQEIKAKMVDRFFGNSETKLENTKTQESLTLKGLDSLINSLSQLLKRS